MTALQPRGLWAAAARRAVRACRRAQRPLPAYTPCVPARECSRTACSHPAVSTLTYVYEDSTAVLGPLSRSSEPHAYDLCRGHASSLTAPRGWELLRVPGSTDVSDDLVALSDADRKSTRLNSSHVAISY